MTLSLQLITQLIPTIVEAVKLAERFIRGDKRGPDKKKEATGFVVDSIKDTLGSIESTQVPNFRAINWLKLILAAPQLADKVGNVIDAVVDLMNFLKQFEEPKQ